MPYSLVVAFVLLLVSLFAIFRLSPPRFRIVTALLTIALLPLLLEPALALYLAIELPLPTIQLPFIASALQPLELAAIIVTLPVLYLLGHYLGQNARNMPPPDNVSGRHFTSVPLVLFLSALALLLTALAAGNAVLFCIGIVLLFYLLSILLRVLRAVSSAPPLDTTVLSKRIIAGNTATVTVETQNKTSLKLYCHVTAVEPWLKISPPSFSLGRVKMGLGVTLTPPLSGPSRPQFHISVTDPWGFMWLAQVATPLKLEVIPRAKYARWLAMKYLEKSITGTAADMGMPPEAVVVPRRGTEYMDSRSYQPGDRLKDIDWKHSLKLDELIVREFIEVGGETAIITADLSVSDADEADKLAFNLITTALTLARNRIPAALAAFNHERVIQTTAATNPDEILKQTIRLVGEINTQEFPERFLQPPDISRLKRNISRLKQSTSPAAQRLLGILDFEFQAVKATARAHPATLALSRVTRHLPPPATIVLVSQPTHNAEALLVTLENLTKGRYTILRVEDSRTSRDSLWSRKAMSGAYQSG